jgi:hypothetical protein
MLAGAFLEKLTLVVIELPHHRSPSITHYLVSEQGFDVRMTWRALPELCAKVASPATPSDTLLLTMATAADRNLSILL